MEKKKIKKIVQDLIKEKNLSPRFDMVKLLEDEGFTVIKKDLGNYSGLIYDSPKENLKVIAVNEKETHVERRRFTLAHEYGHYILHNNSSDGVCAFRSIINLNTVTDDVREIEANYFAAELLMPEDSVRQICKNETFLELKLLKMKATFCVSRAAALVRLESLGMN